MPYKFLKEIKPREYQKRIFETCRSKNCLVVLPTGLGKTLIGLLLAIERLQKYPGEKVVFLAPTKPLVEQHLVSFKKNLPELFAEITLFTGQIKAEKRKKLWDGSDIIFSTPQCVANDIKKNLYSLDDVCLLIEDEAHRCVKNYDYNYIANTYIKKAKHPRIMGLTASPGNDVEKIKTICRNLSIEEVELRTRESEDVKPYLQELEFEKIKVDFPVEFEELRRILLDIFKQYIDELKNRKVLYGSYSKMDLIELQKKISGMISRNSYNFNLMLAASACAQAIKILHAIELLETQTLNSFNNYLENLLDQAKKRKSKGVEKLINKKEFRFVYSKTNEMISKEINHPKIEKIKELVTDEIKKTPKSKLIIFTQYRDTAQEISKTLNTINKIKAKVFVGQAKKSSGSGKTKTSSGLSQKEQKQIIEDFSGGKINVLCATSLHPEEFIILKKGNRISIKKIGEFVDSILSDKNKNSKKITEWEALSTDGEKLVFKPITHIHKHKAKDNLIKVKSASGFDSLITKDHEMFSFNEKNKFTAEKPETNKFVAQALNYSNQDYIKEIDIIKESNEKNNIKNLFGSVKDLSQAKIRELKTELSVLSQLKSQKLNITQITKYSKKDYSTVMKCLARLKRKNLITQEREKKNYKNNSIITEKGKKYLDFLEWFFKNVKYNKKKYRFKIDSSNKKIYNEFLEQHINVNYGKKDFPRKLRINKYLARFLGFYVSEGYARKTEKTSGIFIAARNKEVQDLIKKSIEKGLKLEYRKNKNGIAIDSQISYYLIKDIFRAGLGANHKEIPEFIFTCNDSIKWEFLYAYFLGDGYKSEDRIVFTTISRKLVTGIVFLLRMLGIKRITLHKQGNIYRINISESLPFAKIKEKNEKSLKSYYSLIPTALESKKAFKIYSNFYSRPNSKIKPRKVGSWEKDICFDYIKKIEKIKKPKFVYDITVKDTKNFIGGTGLFCLHNCIAEEGLDIPEVNAVVFYESIPSAIRAIQRAGRTARLKKGKLIMLITKKTRDETFYYISKNREKKMKKAISSIKEDLSNNKLNFKEHQKKLF